MDQDYFVHIEEAVSSIIDTASYYVVTEKVDYYIIVET